MCRLDSENNEEESNGSRSAKEHKSESGHTKQSVDQPASRHPSVAEMIKYGRALLYQICLCAKEGQKLPQLTIFWSLQIVLQMWMIVFSDLLLADHPLLYLVSISLLFFTTTTTVAGYTLLILLYRHSISTIFNRQIPQNFLPSFAAHLALLRPLEILWRYLTARFRVLPDVLVLGEVRCGTTTLCQHLASFSESHEPFCLWKHPELDKKETFYFVGHYLKMVTPSKYRMCFPLKLTKWWSEVIWKKPFFTFDGCAQYLTSPAAPYLIARAYRDAGLPPPVLVACVRNPVDQTVSWWRYENNAMLWGEGMGLGEWNSALRSTSYPPLTLSEALDFSHSPEVSKKYADAEALASNDDLDSVPEWSMTWPAGQLSGIGRNGAYIKNIERYERVFAELFSGLTDEKRRVSPQQSDFQYVNVVPLESFKNDAAFDAMMQTLVGQINQRKQSGPKIEKVPARIGVHRNAGVKLTNSLSEPTTEEKERVKSLFQHHTAQLERRCGVKFGW